VETRRRIRSLEKQHLRNFEEASRDELWIKFMDKELDQIDKNDNWELVLRPRNKNVIRTKWVLIQVDIGGHPPIPTGSS